MKRKNRRLSAGFAFFLGLLLLAGCQKGAPLPETTPADTTTNTPVPTGTTELVFTVDSNYTTAPPETPEETTAAVPEGPILRNVLTGLSLAQGDDGTRRPMAVIINNLKRALPQAGIAQADVIFEVEAEENITRLIAVFYDPSNVSKLGTVRSTRSAFVNICAGLDAFMVHAGGSPQSYTDFKALSVPSIDGIYDGNTFYRDQNRIKNNGYEHSMYTTGQRLANKWAALAKTNARMALKSGYKAPFAFYETDTTPADGKKCVKVTTLYGDYQPRFSYQEGTGLYLRYEYGAAHMDEAAGSQLAFKNVVVLSVTSSRIKGDTAMRRKFDDVGSGTGIYATNGVFVTVRWSKASASAPLVLTDASGAPLKLNPGKTFISYVNGASQIKTE